MDESYAALFFRYPVASTRRRVGLGEGRVRNRWFVVLEEALNTENLSAGRAKDDVTSPGCSAKASRPSSRYSFLARVTPGRSRMPLTPVLEKLWSAQARPGPAAPEASPGIPQSYEPLHRERSVSWRLCQVSSGCWRWSSPLPGNLRCDGLSGTRAASTRSALRMALGASRAGLAALVLPPRSR